MPFPCPGTGQICARLGTPSGILLRADSLPAAPHSQSQTHHVRPRAPTRPRKRLLVSTVALPRLRSGDRASSQVQSWRRPVSRSCGSCSWAHSRSTCQWRGRVPDTQPVLAGLSQANQAEWAGPGHPRVRWDGRAALWEPRATRNHCGWPLPLREQKTQPNPLPKFPHEAGEQKFKWRQGPCPRGQAGFLDSPGQDCTPGEAAAQLVGCPPVLPTPERVNAMWGLAEPSVTSQLAEWVGEDPRRCYWRRTTCQGLEQHMWAKKSLHMDG